MATLEFSHAFVAINPCGKSRSNLYGVLSATILCCRIAIRGHLINLGTKNCLDLICPHFEITLCLPNHVIFPKLPSETQKCWFLLFLKKSGHPLKRFWIRFLGLLSVNHKYLKHLISYTVMPRRMAIVAHCMAENRKVWKVDYCGPKICPFRNTIFQSFLKEMH